MQPNHRFRPLGGGGNLVHVQTRRICGQDGTGLCNGIELGEQGFFDRHVLKHGFNHQVRVGQGLQRQRARQQRHACVHIGQGQAATLGGVVIIFADRGDAAIQRVLSRLNQCDRHTGVEKVHRNAAAHGARADDAHLGTGQGGRIRRHIGDFPGRTLGKESIALGG